MPDFDPKNIPILDDIIEDNLIEKEKTEHSDEDTDIDTNDGLDENNFDLFSSETTVTADEDQQTEPEDEEPQLGSIDHTLYPETGETVVDSLDAATEDIAEEETQSALIDYRAEGEDDSASNRVVFTDPADGITIDDSVIDDSTTDDELSDDELSDDEFSDDTLSDPAITVHAIPDYTLSDAEITEDLSFTVNTGAASAEPAPEQALTQLKPVIDEITDDIVRQLLPDLEQQLRFLVQQALEDRLPDDLVEQLNTEEETPP